MFRKKQTLRLHEVYRLVEQTEKQKQRLNHLNELISHSIDPTDGVLQKQKITKALYSFLLREARYQKVNKNEL